MEPGGSDSMEVRALGNNLPRRSSARTHEPFARGPN
jgi:hypothetical protein